jgi:hypothetical protein
MRALALLAVACGGRAPEVELSRTVEHPLYRVRADLPAGWVADAAHAEIYPADSWMLHPAAGTDPSVSLILGWLPRGGRQSAFFPGGREADAHAETRTIGGAPREGLREGSSFLVDFDVGELAVSIRAHATADAGRATADAIVAHLAFDPAARPPDHPRPARRALELARAWAVRNGQPSDHIVSTGASPDGIYSFTLFHARGLVPLRVDVARETVTQVPL